MSSRKLRLIDGPLHKIKVKFVAQRTIAKAAKCPKDENIRGLYSPDDNLIYVNKDMSEEEQLHVLFHELVHACEFQCSSHQEELRVDTMARFLRQLAKIGSLKDVVWL